MQCTDDNGRRHEGATTPRASATPRSRSAEAGNGIGEEGRHGRDDRQHERHRKACTGTEPSMGRVIVVFTDGKVRTLQMDGIIDASPNKGATATSSAVKRAPNKLSKP